MDLCTKVFIEGLVSNEVSPEKKKVKGNGSSRSTEVVVVATAAAIL